MPAVDPSGEVARRFAENLRKAMDGRSHRATAELTGVNYSTIQSILSGRAWPDLYTIAKLEAGLNTSLWPGLLRSDE